MAGTSYLYKIYNRTRKTITQRVFDGDFEGLSDQNFLAYWGLNGSPRDVWRNKRDAYPTQTPSNGIQLGGNAFLTLGRVDTGATGGDYDIQYSSFSLSTWWYKSSWSVAQNEALVDHISNGSVGNFRGFGLFANAATGNLEAKVCIGTGIDGVATPAKATYALSSLSTGYHNIIFGSDGRYIRLWVDGVLVSTYDNGTVAGIQDANGIPIFAGRNCNNAINSVGTPDYATGIVDEISFYGGLLSDVQAERIYKTHDIIYSGLNLHYELNEGNGTTLLEEMNRIDGGVQGTFTWTTGYGIQERSCLIRTSTTGSTDQGIGLLSGKETYTTPGGVYAASAWAKATAGETIKFSIVQNSGSTIIITYTATGNWQRLQGSFTAPAGCTRVGLRVQIGNANTAIKELFVDQIALNDGTDFLPYFDLNTRNSGSSSYSFDSTIQAHTVTQTFYTFIGTWKESEVASEPTYPEAINTPGSELNVRLARGAGNYGEGTDLDYNLDVKIFAFNDTYPTGIQKFNGYISDYNVDEDGGYIDVKLVGYGAEFQNYMLQTGDSVEAYQPSFNVAKNPTGAWSETWYNIEINPTTIIKLSKIKLRMAVNTNVGNNITMKIWQGDPSINFISVVSGGATTNTPTNNTLVGQSLNTNKPTAATAADYTWQFQNVTLYPGIKYYVDLQVTGGTDGFNSVDYLYGSSADSLSAVSGYAPIGRVWYARAQFNNASFGMARDDTFPMAYMELLSNGGGSDTTTAVYNSYDPGQILREAMDNYQSQGGNVTYDTSSIQLTGTVVSYTFNTASILDVVKKCNELAPPGWYWYVDQAKNKLVFKPPSSTPDHRFILGKHIKSLLFEKRTRDMVNMVIFTGGDIGGQNLFKKYVVSGSVSRYGQRVLQYTDNRVTIENTADTIAEAILSKKSYPEIRTSPEIINYDFETVHIGDVVSFGNYEGDVTTLSKWDVGFWDMMFWDFNGANPTTLELQIAQKNNTPDSVALTLSTQAVDVNKRIEDINRNLEALATVDNPTVPLVSTDDGS